MVKFDSRGGRKDSDEGAGRSEKLLFCKERHIKHTCRKANSSTFAHVGLFPRVIFSVREVPNILAVPDYLDNTFYLDQLIMLLDLHSQPLKLDMTRNSCMLSAFHVVNNLMTHFQWSWH